MPTKVTTSLTREDWEEIERERASGEFNPADWSGGNYDDAFRLGADWAYADLVYGGKTVVMETDDVNQATEILEKLQDFVHAMKRRVEKCQPK